MNQSNTIQARLGLALSGGGIRAAVFHLGVLRLLAARGLFHAVSHLSTVSGGSLAAAAVMSAGGMRWPTSSDYLTSVLPRLRQILTTRDLLSFRALGIAGTARHNIGILNNRAGILADTLRRQWEVNGKLGDLPDSPIWWINTTCIETGKNWRFSKREMGDWQFGRHYEPPFELADAVAASAAVPYAVGALRLTLPRSGWYETDPATRKPVRPIDKKLETVRLWDGGAYENLGLEPLFKVGQGLKDFDFLICSDASAPLKIAPQRSQLLSLLKGQLASPRLFDISSDQIRALRSRMFMGAITRGEIRGALLRIGNSTRHFDLKSSSNRAAEEYDGMLSEDQVALAAGHPTDLKALTPAMFDMLERHGYEVAFQVISRYAHDLHSQGQHTHA